MIRKVLTARGVRRRLYGGGHIASRPIHLLAATTSSPGDISSRRIRTRRGPSSAPPPSLTSLSVIKLQQQIRPFGRYGRPSKKGGSSDRLANEYDLEGGKSYEEITANLPKGVDTSDMSTEELEALGDAYKLVKAKEQEKKVFREEAEGQPDVSYIYAASNDPIDHLEQGAEGTIYTITDEEYRKYFPGPWTKPNRIPFESGLQETLDRKFLLIRPPAQHLLQHLHAFAEGRFPKAAEVQQLRKEWIASGGAQEAQEAATGPDRSTSAAAAAAPPPPEEEGEEMEEEEGEEEGEGLVAKEKGEEEGKKEEEEEDDDYDLFGADEDEDEGAAREKAKGETKIERRRDPEIYGTLRRLAVDENLVHADQKYELPLTPSPTPSTDGKKSIFVLSGSRGVGKSASLYHAVHYARSQGWLVLLIPSAYEYLHEGGLVKPSPYFKGYFDTPDLATTTLQQLLQAHDHQLAQLPIQDPLTLERSGLKSRSTLLDLVNLGLQKSKCATTALVDVKHEMEKQERFPFLVAIDEFSEWFHPSEYYYALKKIEGSRLAIVKMLKDLVPISPRGPHDDPLEASRKAPHHKHNLFVIVARSEKYPRVKDKKKAGIKRLVDKADLPRPLPKRLSYDVEVDRYSAREFDTMYKLIGDAGLWGPGATWSEGMIAATRTTTSSNPEVLAKDAVAIECRIFRPQNKVGKIFKHAPKDFSLGYVLEEIDLPTHPPIIYSPIHLQQCRIFGPQNKVGKISKHAPKDLSLGYVIEDIEGFVKSQAKRRGSVDGEAGEEATTKKQLASSTSP